MTNIEYSDIDFVRSLPKYMSDHYRNISYLYDLGIHFWNSRFEGRESSNIPKLKHSKPDRPILTRSES